MNKSQTKDFRMFMATRDCLAQKRIRWENILAIVQLNNRLIQNIATLKELNKKKSSTASTPATTNKVQLKDLLDLKIDVVKGIVLSYAHANNLKELEQNVKLLAKGFSKKRETDVEPHVRSFLDLVRLLQPKLTAYELTDDLIVDLETALDQFVAQIGTPRSLVVQGSSINKQIAALVKETNSFLVNQLDNLFLRFKEKDVDFYNSYTQARQVVEPASDHRDNPDDPDDPDDTEK